jgi:hypothetical protein
MKVGVFGSRDWSSYPDIIRSLTVFIQESHELGHDSILFVHSGSKGAENMITEYIGKTEKFLKEKNFKIKEEISRADSQIMKDMGVIESGLDYALVFSTECKRTKACQRVLKEYNIPFKIIESA